MRGAAFQGALEHFEKGLAEKISQQKGLKALMARWGSYRDRLAQEQASQTEMAWMLEAQIMGMGVSLLVEPTESNPKAAAQQLGWRVRSLRFECFERWRQASECLAGMGPWPPKKIESEELHVGWMEDWKKRWRLKEMPKNLMALIATEAQIEEWIETAPKPGARMPRWDAPRNSAEAEAARWGDELNEWVARGKVAPAWVSKERWEMSEQALSASMTSKRKRSL